MKFNLDHNHQELKPSKVDMWYDRHERSWVVQLKDQEENQIGEATYVYSKPEALSQVEYLKKTYGLSE